MERRWQRTELSLAGERTREISRQVGKGHRRNPPEVTGQGAGAMDLTAVVETTI